MALVMSISYYRVCPPGPDKGKERSYHRFDLTPLLHPTEPQIVALISLLALRLYFHINPRITVQYYCSAAHSITSYSITRYSTVYIYLTN